MEKYSSTRKAFAPVAYGSKTFNPAKLKMSIYAKEFLAIFFAFKEFGHIFWGTLKLVIILTDNKSVNRFFFKLKSFHQLCGTRVTTLSSSILQSPIFQAKTTSQLDLSRLEVCPKEKLILRIREDILTTPIELNSVEKESARR